MGRRPVTTLEEMDSLNSDEVIEGYFDAFRGEASDPEPGDNRSLSYWHGWRNGRTDAGFAGADEAQRELARRAIARGPRP